MKWIPVCLFLTSFSSNVLTTVQQCTDRFMQLPLVEYRAQHASKTASTLGNVGRVLVDYQFNCSFTNITSLILGIDVRIATNSRTLFPSVQLYRPHTNIANQYNLVTGSVRTIYYSPSNVSTSGVFEYPLNPPMSVMSGDLLAVSQPSPSNSVVRVHYISNILGVVSLQFTNGISPAVVSNPTTRSNQLVLVYPVTSDGDCLNSLVSASVIKQYALTTHSRANVAERRQYLYPWITFSCNGTVTKWIYGAGEMTGASRKRYPELQIWRQLGTNNYKKIGASLVNTSTSIAGTNNLYELTPQTPLEFQEGDIFGVHSPDAGDSKQILYEQRSSGPLDLRRSGNNPFSTISTTLVTDNNNDFPLVTVEISVSVISVSFSAVLPPSATNLGLLSSSLLLPTISNNLPMATSTDGVRSFSLSIFINTFTLFSVASTQSQSTASTITSSYQSFSSDSLTFSSSSNSVTPTTVFGSVSFSLINIVAGIITTLAVLLIAGVIAAMILIIACKRRRKRTANVKLENKAFHNPTYESTDIPINGSHLTAAAANIYNPIYGDSHQETHSYKDQFPYESMTMHNDTTIDATGTAQHDISYNMYRTLQNELYVPTATERTQHSCTTNEGIYSFVQSTQSPYSTLNHTQQFFPEEPIYWEPGADTDGIYQQLSDKRYREIVRQQIQVTGHLGSGQFGTVNGGVWNSPTAGPVNVAIKTLNDNTSAEEKVKFLQEAAIMGQFHHPNIVKLHGVVTIGEPTMIVLELISGGELRDYLHRIRPSPGELVPSTVPGLLLGFCRQIASGMKYLSGKSFVHRDLAARNILVTEQAICKIADFGMSRDLQDENYYISNAKKIPIKWTAPEALHFKRYSTASDVWSYGAVLYEIWSLGHKPFEKYTNQECMRLIESGYRLPPPPGCPRAVYELMIQCWHPETGNRPTFAKLASSLSSSDDQLLSTETGRPLVLGGSLESAYELYSDLQKMYM